MSKTLEKLKDDKHYYGKFGKQFLSNSDIRNLLNNPAAYLEQGETTLQMVHGRYLHTAVLEPHKLYDFEIVDVASRNTKTYREIEKIEPLILRPEKEALDAMVNRIKHLWGEEIYQKHAQYEVPAIGKIASAKWKGKADILIPGEKIIDIKTTADMSKFKRSAWNYNYDSQAFIYGELFGVPVEFYVIDKSTLQCKRFTCSDEFLERGMEKAAKAVAQYDKFFGPDAKYDVNEYVETDML